MNTEERVKKADKEVKNTDRDVKKMAKGVKKADKSGKTESAKSGDVGGKAEGGKTTGEKTKGEKTRRKLFDCAAQLFNQYTFDEVTVDKIVETAGVAKGTFYIYFESKDALIAACMADYVKRVDTDYRAVLESFPPDASSSEVLLELISKIADTLTDTIGYTIMRTVYNMQLTTAVDMNVVKSYNRELYQIFADLLDRGLQRGEFRNNFTLEVLTRHFVMAIRGLSYEWCIRHPDFNLKKEALIHFQLLLSGIEADRVK